MNRILLQEEEGAKLAVHPNGITVPEAVREILTQSYPIYQCLKMKLTNFHSVAEHIQPRIQELTGRKTTINTLVVAIKRFSDTLEQSKTPEAVKVLENLRISLTGGVTDLTLKVRKPDVPKIIRELSDIGAELSEFPNIFPLTNSVKIILHTHDYDLLRTKLHHLSPVQIQENVAKLSLYLPIEAWNTPGIASYITELLYRNGINIIDAFLGHGDIIIVVKEADGHIAYDVLRKELHSKA